MNLNKKNFGLLIIGLSLILFVILTFVKIDMDEREVFLCDAVSSNPDLDMAQCPAHNDNSSWLVVGAFGIAFLIFGIGLYLTLIKKEKAGQDFRKVDISKLNEEEKKIYDLVKGREGSMYQSDIIKETELSKVSVTRILDRMEGKGVLERKRRGMTNIIILK